MENEIEEIQAEEEVTQVEEPLFTSEITHDLPTRKEINKRYAQLHLSGSISEITVGIMLVVLFAYLFLYQKNYAFYARTYFVFALVYWGSNLVKIIRNRNGGPVYKQMLKANGGQPIHNLITFTEEGLSVLNTYRESRSDYTYDQITSVAQSENLFLLYRGLSQCTVVAKNTLTGGTPEEFLAFLAERCPNWPNAILRTNSFGRNVRKVLIALWVISLALAVYGLFLAV